MRPRKYTKTIEPKCAVCLYYAGKKSSRGKHLCRLIKASTDIDICHAYISFDDNIDLILRLLQQHSNYEAMLNDFMCKNKDKK